MKIATALLIAPLLAYAQPPAATNGPSYSDTVAWIQAHLHDAGTPGQTVNCLSGSCPGTPDGITVTDPQRYDIHIDGCDSVTIHSRTGEHASAASGKEVYDNVSDETLTVPFRAVASFSGDNAGVVRVTAAEPGIKDETDYPGSESAEQIPLVRGSYTVAQANRLLEQKSFYSMLLKGDDASVLTFSSPGTASEAPHMANALNHLVQICKEHPEQVPKSPF